MIVAIAAKECRELARDGRMWIAAAAMVLLLLGALAVAWRSAREIAAQHEDAARTSREHWVNQPPKNPHSAAHYGIYAVKPKPTLAFVDEGIDPYTGVAVYLEAHVRNEFVNRPAADATMLQRFASLTAATVLQVLVPLLILVVVAGVVAGERDQGTLRQLLSLGVRPFRLVAGKMLGVGVVLALLLVPAAVIGSGALAITGGLAPSAGRVGVLTGAYAAYFVIWLGIGVAVSTAAPSARSALIVLLGLWMINSVLVPRGATDLARRLHPTPSALEFQQTLAQEQRVDPTGKTYEQFEQEVERQVLERYGVESVSQLPVSFAGVSLDASEQWSDRVFDRNFGRLWHAFGEQERVRAYLGLVFPHLAIRGVSQGLAGTDLHHHRDFTEAAERYRRYLVKRMNDELREHGKGKDFQYVSDVAVWRDVEPFEYRSPSLGFVLRHRAVELAALGTWMLGAIGMALVAARRVSP